MDRYACDREHYLHDALAQPTARAVATRLLRGAVEGDTQKGRPRGCLNVQGALACSPEHHDVSSALAQRRAAGQALIQERFERAATDGDLPPTTNCATLARYLETVVEGIMTEDIRCDTGTVVPQVDGAQTIWFKQSQVVSITSC